MTSANVRAGVTVSTTAREPRPVRNEMKGFATMPEPNARISKPLVIRKQNESQYFARYPLCIPASALVQLSAAAGVITSCPVLTFSVFSFLVFVCLYS
jgi:hypothetical protein